MRYRANEIRIGLCNIFLASLLILLMVDGIIVDTPDIELKIVFGEEHENIESGVAQLFYSDYEEEFTEENSLMEDVVGNEVMFRLPQVDLLKTRLRFDPFMSPEVFSISQVEILYRGRTVFTISGEELIDYILETVNCEYTDNGGTFISFSDDPIICFENTFGKMIFRKCQNSTFYFGIAIVVYLMFGILQIQIKRKEHSARLTQWHFLAVFVAAIVISSGVSLNYGISYLEKNFGEVPFGQLLYHLHTPLDGVNTSSFQEVFWTIIGIVVVVFVISFLLDYLLRRTCRHFGYPFWLGILGVLIGVHGLIIGYNHFDYGNYYKYIHENTILYEEYYVDGRDVELMFPEKKRNLIYIILESMEITYADEKSGGAMQENYIPELTQLSLENISFSDDEWLNGAHTVPGATFTMGALVAQTAGVPINETLVSNDTLNGYWESEDNYLPGAWALGDVLATQGYNQVFMIGSDASFAGRGSYFRGHGNYEIFDYGTAVSAEKIPEDYCVWWGYEDTKLITFAKEKLLTLAKEEPFNFTMLTVDTHFTDGYVCEACGDEYDSQYSNVIACSSAQIANFVNWIQQQDFYDNTTIIISGDHLTMDSAYIQMMGADTFDRKTYLAIINPADGCAETVTRKYTTMDLYPTTLASLGVQIEGNRLGLGVNLFSDTPTLYEQYGGDYLDEELLKSSDLYTKKLLYDN